MNRPKFEKRKMFRRLLVWFLTFFLIFQPISTLASTPIDSEIYPVPSRYQETGTGVQTSQPHWYAFASYFEIYSVEPSQEHISQVEKTIKENKLPDDSLVIFT